MQSAVDSMTAVISELQSITLNLKQDVASMSYLNLSIYESTLDPISSSLSATNQKFATARDNTASMIALLDQIDADLETEISLTADYQLKTQEGIVKLDSTINELDAAIDRLSAIDPSLEQRIDKPIVHDIQKLFENLRPIEASFGTVFSMVIVFISTLFAVIISLLEINSRAALRNSLTPTSEAWNVIGLVITAVLAVAVQAAVLLFVAQYLLGIDVMAKLDDFIMVGALLSMTFVCIGTAIGLFVRKEQASILVAAFVVLIVLLFSDVLTAPEFMPVAVSNIVALNPLVIAGGMLKQALLFSHSPAAMMPLSIWFAGALLLLSVAYIKFKRTVIRW
jgi:ABC-type multidrug transport system permease subunit